MAKETYGYTSIPEVCVCVSVKRGLSSGKRDLLHTQKRPTDILTYLRELDHSLGSNETDTSPISCDQFGFSLGFRVQGLGFRVQGLGFRVQGLGFRVQLRVQGVVWGPMTLIRRVVLRLVCGLGFRVQGIEIQVQSLEALEFTDWLQDQGLGMREEGLGAGIRDQGLGITGQRLQSLRFGFQRQDQGLGMRDQG